MKNQICYILLLNFFEQIGLSQQWNALGPGLTDDVLVIVANGTDVYAGGSFFNEGGNPDLAYIARWDGCEWHAVAPGIPENEFFYVDDLAISGSDIYVAGYFIDAGGNPDADGIARWDGSSWNALGTDCCGWVASSIVISGSDVFVGGDFDDAGGNPDADGIARWDGSSWHALGTGIQGWVNDIAISGNDVYVVGQFDNAGGNPDADNIARWDGSSWHALGSIEDNNGNWSVAISSVGDVYVGGNFCDIDNIPNTSGIARWDGSSWHALGTGLSPCPPWSTFGARAIEISGSDVYVGGEFEIAGNVPNTTNLAYWDGNSWNALGTPNLGLWETVFAVTSSDDDVYIGGNIGLVGNVPNTDGIARWGPPGDSIGIPEIFDTICDADVLYTLPTIINGFTGNWSGDGVNDNMFWPENQCGLVPLMFTPDPGQCVSPEETEIFVVNLWPTFPDIYSTCDDNGTPQDDTDDIIVIHINGQGCYIGDEYQPDSPSGVFTPLTGVYGEWSEFQLEPGSAGNGVVYLTITTIEEPICYFGEAEWIEDPGTCSLPLDCPTAGEDIVFTYYPFPDQPFHLLDLLGGDPGGTWDPPLSNPGPSGDWYWPCDDGEGEFTYTIDSAGCPVSQATITIQWLWDPCDWLITNVCELESGEYSVTIPAFPGPHPDVNYDVEMCNQWQFAGENFDLDSTYTLITDSQEPGWECTECLYVQIWFPFPIPPELLPLAPGWDIAWIYLLEYGCDFPPCTCSDPPEAGEDNTINSCVYANPFDLYEILGGNPDPDGIWSPPLASGGNLYDPVLDGPGTYTYTVTAPDCPDDMASVTVGVVDLSGSSILVGCDDNDTPSDSTDDIITIMVTPAGYHTGTNYTVSVSSGTIMPSTGLYNTTTTFLLQPGSAGNGNVTFTITDNESPFCSFDFLIEDPGTCSSNPPCPSAGTDTTYTFFPSTFFNLLFLNGADPGGTWDPPLSSGGNLYSPCEDGEGSFSYTQDNPGCPIEVTTITMIWLWDPCDWEIEEICSTENGVSITLPPFPGPHPDEPYEIEVCGAFYSWFDLDSTNTVIVLQEDADQGWECLDTCYWVDIHMMLPGPPPANMDFFAFILGGSCNVPLCSCSTPPNAGEDSSLNICVDDDPFDLTTSIGDTPDPGGTWSPPLNSGGNIYDPVLDGPGTYTYTVTAPDCPDDMANVTVGVVDLSVSTILVSCDDNGTPLDETDDIISITVTPLGYHVGTNYTVSISSGTITPGTGLYNTTTNFQLQPGSAGNGDVTLTITDNASPFCSFDFLIEDPGTCSYPCPPGMDTVLFIDSLGIVGTVIWEGNMLLWFDLPTDGYWEPPLQLPGLYNFCLDDASVYIYTHIYPGCEPVQDTVDFDLLWNPCNWVFESICNSEDSIYFTIPPFIGGPPGATYYLNLGNPYGIYPNLSIDSTYTFVFENFFGYGSCLGVQLILNGFANWDWGLAIDYDYYDANTFVICPPPCSCSDPPDAGDDNSISVCSDTMPFDLTLIINGNPDPGGGWSPPLTSGGNIYDPVLDGSGSFDYTVVADGCPDATATVTLTVTPLFQPPITGVPSTICEEAIPIPLPTIQSGITGNWSGDGVSNNTFDPDDLMGTIVLTFTPDPDQCAQDAETVILVTAPVQTPISGIPSTYCESSPPWPLPTIQSGINGNWSGTGVANNIFNPSGLSGMVTLTFTPLPNQCALPAIHTINVGLPISPLIVLPGTMCILSPPIALDTILSGIHGNWSGQGVSNNIFNPAGLNGSITLTFTPNAGECASIATATIDVIEELTYNFSIPDSICQMDPPIQLPINPGNVFGNWSGPGVSNNMFNPDSQSGTISLSFIPDAGQCAVSATISIVVTVLQEPDVSSVPSVLCNSSVPFDLPTELNGITGEWSGPDVSNNSFDPSSSDGIVTLTFTPWPGQCALGTVALVNVITEAIISITEFTDTVCSSAMPINLVTIQDSFIGNWSGPGVINNTFNPASLSGDQLLVFQPENTDCVDPASANIYVQNEYSPVITSLPNSICQLNTIALPAEVDGIIGTWDGMGVTDFLFDPNGLSDSVLLQFNPDTGQCAANASAYIIITPSVQPVITAAPSSICQNNTSILLSNIQDGISGSWSGPGILQDSFSPVNLSGIVLISFLPDSGQCALPVNSTIEILQPPGFTNLIATCDSLAQSYNVSFDIQGGLNGTYEVNGNMVTDSHYISNPIDDDSMFYSFLLDDANQCGPVIIDGAKNCACATAAGTMDFTVNPVKVCDGNDFTVVHMLDENLDTDDILLFILHDQPDGLLGTIFGISNTSTFSFPTGINYGQVYYVSAVAGSTIGVDSVDLLDPCLSVSQGVPVIFLPTAQSSIQSTLCSDDSIVVHNVVYNMANPTGTETIIGGSLNDCDSIISVQLSFWPDATYNLTETLCFGSSIVVNSTVYDETNPTGTEVKPGGSIHGCDSIIHIDLTFDSIVQGDLQLMLCQGDSIVINGNVYDENHFEDDEVFINGSSQGCDSVLHVKLEFYQAALFEIKDTLDIGDSLIVEGVAYHVGYPAGIAIIAGGSSNGCDSIIEIELHFRTSVLTASIQSIPPLCFGDSTGVVTIESVNGNFDTIRLSLDGMPTLLVNDFPFSIYGLTAGMHSLWMVDVASTSDTLWLEFYLEEPQALELDAGPDQNVTFGEDVQLNAQASFTVDSWLWSPADFLSCTDCPDPVVIHPLHDILYTLLAEDQNNCQVSDDVLIQVIDDVEVYFPTVFSPNGDGINDLATVHTNQDLLVKSLSIYDRWGNLVARQTDFPANDPANGWDGRFNGEEMGPGVYVWVVEVVLRSGIITVSKGDLTLIR